MIKKVYSNKFKAGWLHRPDGWPADPKRRRFMSWGFDEHWRDAAGTEHRKKESGFICEHEARIAAHNYKQAVLRTRYGIPQLHKMPTMVQLVEKHLPQITSPNEQVRATRLLKALLIACGKTLPVNELHTSHLMLFVDRLKSDGGGPRAGGGAHGGVGPSTIDRALNIVSTMLHRAIDYFPALSQWRPPKLPRPKVSKRRRERIIKVEEITRLLTYLYREPEPGETSIQIVKRRNVAHVFRLALLTASRKGEICKLRWDQIDWQAGTFQLVGTKNEFSQARTARYPKITDAIAEIFRERWLLQAKGDFPWNWSTALKSSSAVARSRDIPVASQLSSPIPGQAKNTPTAPLTPALPKSVVWESSYAKPQSRFAEPRASRCPYVFTRKGGEVTHYYDIIAEAAHACGLLYGRKTLGGFVTHDARHTGVSYLLNLGHNFKTIGELTGHTDATMVLLYSHVDPKIVAAAYEDLDRHFAATGTLGRIE